LAVAVVFPEIQRWSSSSLTIDATRLRLATVQRGEFIRDVSVQGKVVAAIRPMLFSPQDGRVTTLVRAGDTVRKNDVLAVIESPELLSDFKQEQSTLQKLEAELSRQEIATRMAQLEHNKSVTLSEMALIAANRELRRAETAHQQNAISAQDYEKAIDDRNRAAAVSRHKGEEASLKTEQLKLELDILNHALNRQKLLVMELDRKIAALSVLSPVDGVVGNLEVEQKSIVARYQKIMSVVDMSAYEVEARVPETYADELAQGMAVDIDLSGKHFAGELSAISPEVENGQVRCRIRFVDEKPSGLRQNQRVASRIFLDSRDDVLTVARGPFMQSGSRGYAYVVEDGMAIKTPIVAGMTSAGRVEILSGLKEGQEIVISSSDVFDRHERVLLINQNSPQQES
jgi:HlyD family secretion protein